MKQSVFAIALLSATAFAAPALAAAPIYTGGFPTEIASPGTISFTATSPKAGSSNLSFDLLGFSSLDGVNFYEDDFTLNVNGSSILSLSYDLGGSGSNVVFTQPAGTAISGGSNGFFLGGTLNITLPVALLAGVNTFSFSYASPSGDALGGAGTHAGPQGTGDEGWAVDNIVLAAPTPEPEAWASMIVGLGLAGFVARRRARKMAATA